jgi:hypothetical protein
MFEAFECFMCRQVLVLFGADSSRCPGCGSSHGKLITRDHLHQGSKDRARSKRGARAPGRSKKTGSL